MGRWDYLRLEWRSAAMHPEEVTRRDARGVDHTRVEYVKGEKAEYIAEYGGQKHHHAEDAFDFVGFLNERGSEGWELVSETVRASVVEAGNGIGFPNTWGWSEVGRPVWITWLFKRAHGA